MKLQLELFDAVQRRKKCLRCRCRLHPDRKGQYRTRLAGLCYRCLAAYERWPHWNLQRFVLETQTDLKNGSTD